MEKCAFSQSSVRFLGQIVDAAGIHADPDKLKAIQDLRELTSDTELRRFVGMVIQLAKFAPHLADRAKPLRELFSARNQWSWGEPQQRL